MSEGVAIVRPNAIQVHVGSEFGLLLLSGATASVTSIPGSTAAKVNVHADTPEFTVGVAYRVGGILIEKGEAFSLPKAIFEGYGVGLSAHVATFKQQIVAP